jgi:YHS domain-containing protein
MRPLLLLIFALSVQAQAPKNHAMHMLEGAFGNAACSSCANKPRIGIMIDGYCPVALTELQSLVLGQRAYRARFWGKEYYLANSANLVAFRKNPKRFVMGVEIRYRRLIPPLLDGHCPVALVDNDTLSKGSTQFQVFLGGQLFYCSSPEARKRLIANGKIASQALASYRTK